MYKEAKEFKPKNKMGRSEISLEQKAIQNLSNAHKIIKDLNDANLHFIQTLKRDLRHYHTLSTKSIRRIGAQELFEDKESIRYFLEGIAYLKQHLGENYLDGIESRTKGKSKEVIIAIENNDLRELLHTVG